MPVVTRLYAQASLVITAVSQSLVAVIAAIACLRYELAIVLSEETDDATHVVILCLALAIVIVLLVFVLVLIMRLDIAAALGLSNVNWVLWILPVCVLARS